MLVQASPQQVVFEEITILDENNSVISRESTGVMTNHLYQRFMRPYTYTGPDEPFIYDSMFSVEYTPDGKKMRTRRITARVNDNPTPEVFEEPAPPQLDETLAFWNLSPMDNDGEALLRVNIKVRNLPRYNIPLPTPRGLLSAESAKEADYEREQKVLQRQATAFALFSDVENSITGAGGEIISRTPMTGWITAEIPQSLLPELSTRTDLKFIHLDRLASDNACDEDCDKNTFGTSGDYTPYWILGEGRRSDFLDADRFIDNGFDASIANPNRHSHGRLMIAVMERLALLDEMCYMLDSDDCYPLTSTTRLRYKYKNCASDGSCEEGGNLPLYDTYDATWAQEAVAHAVAVSSIAVSDYRNGQGDAWSLEDQCYEYDVYDLEHCTNWENNATGMAPRTYWSFYGENESSSNFAGAYLHATAGTDPAIHADVINLTNTTIKNQCDPFSSEIDADAIETAYDNGAFVVIATGNRRYEPIPTSCDLDHPADTPKAFTVASINTDLPSSVNCRGGDYQSCSQYFYSSRRGGASFTTVDNTTSTDLTLVDMIAPGCVAYRGSPVGNETVGLGRVLNGFSGDCGSSYAAPHVSGTSLLVKHWFLNEGAYNINAPGALFAVMLAMGDRWSTNSSAQIETGGDPWSGFGRLKLRKFDDSYFGPAAYHLQPYTFTSHNSTYTYYPFTYRVSNAATFLKCVTHQGEDVSSWNRVAHVSLKVEAVDPTIQYIPGQPLQYICTGDTPVRASIEDNSYDIKHMVSSGSGYTVDISQFRLKCLKVTLTAHLPQKYVWPLTLVTKPTPVHTFCYIATKEDQE